MKLVAFTLDELDAYLGSDDVLGKLYAAFRPRRLLDRLAAGSTQGSTPPSPPGTLPQPPSSPERPAQVNLTSPIRPMVWQFSPSK
jgi:hypothetical protein